MTDFDRKKHWENIYATKSLEEVSWYQPTPTTSLEFIQRLQLPTTASIIDIGGGDSLLVDHLLDAGYTDISVLDISENAIERAKQRLGTRANAVKWIVSDIVLFQTDQQYDLWHDRAAFHFLTQDRDIQRYLHLLQQHVCPNGQVIIATFSETGPQKCSGIPIRQYTTETMAQLLQQHGFDSIYCDTFDHPTPFNTTQNFVFGSFRKNEAPIE